MCLNGVDKCSSAVVCSGLKGRRPFWLLSLPARGGGGGPSLLLLTFSFSGDEEVE